MLQIGLDAGHGGSDPGCQHHGIIEAEYNMGLARGVHRMLGELKEGSDFPFNPVMIRSRDDETIPLFERGNRSKQANCDLLISLHVNAARDVSFHGCLTFHMTGSKVARKVAAEIAHCWPKPLRKQGWGPVAATDGPSEDDDWLQRPRAVLMPHECPAVLVEVGYASNLYDAQALKSKAIQAAMMAAILAGCCQFRRVV